MGYFRDEKFLKDFGRHLQEIRKEKGFTQESLANECDFEISQISRIERGISNASISTIYKISCVLGLELNELFDFNKKVNEAP